MTTPGGPAVLGSLLALLPACMFEGWAGAGAVRVPGAQAETRRVWTLGASFGFYLDRANSRVRVAVVSHADKTYVNAPSVTSTRSGGHALRGDLMLSEPESEETLTRVTGIASWGADATAIDIEGATYPAGGTPAKLFLGLTRTLGDRERRNELFSNSLSYSVGPWFSRWSLDAAPGADPMSAGTLWGGGGEVRITAAISPNTILGFLGMTMTAIAEAPNPPPSSSPSSSAPASSGPAPSCTTRTTCTPGANGGQICTPFTTCR